MPRQYNNPPPYVDRAPETEPLLPGKASRRPSGSINQWTLTALITILAVVTTIAIFVSVFPLRSCNDPVDPAVRERIREEWDVERRQHQHEVLRRIDIEHRWRVEDEERVNIRQQWMREIEEHERNLSEAIRRENQQREDRRVQWEKEEEEHRRYLQERQKREEEERQRMNMFWTDPESHTCTSYGTREYTARLVNVPANYNRRVEACMATPIQVHGVEYKAKWCEDHGPSNVIGHWEVDQHEPDCTPYWNWYKDWGCVSPGSGQRRIEHYLESLPQGGDWREFCATTPASFRGMHFIGAHLCFQKNFGTYGHWVFDDESCN